MTLPASPVGRGLSCEFGLRTRPAAEAACRAQAALCELPQIATSQRLSHVRVMRDFRTAST
jgi:hypothetical protein